MLRGGGPLARKPLAVEAGEAVQAGAKRGRKKMRAGGRTGGVLARPAKGVGAELGRGASSRGVWRGSGAWCGEAERPGVARGLVL
jgi:hypothetical protein